MKMTTHATPETAEHKWVHLDADGAVLGRLAVRVARILMGKDKPIFTPHVDTGDFVVITNAEKVRVTGRKAETKVYRHHTGYIGSLVERPYERMIEEKPEEVVMLAVRRMLPKSKLGKQMIKKLKIYRGPEHPHTAQAPETITL